MNCEVKNYIKRIIAVIDATFAFAKRKPVIINWLLLQTLMDRMFV